jgi:hypothetical protein
MDYLPSVGDPFGEPKTNSKPAASPLFFCFLVLAQASLARPENKKTT